MRRTDRLFDLIQILRDGRLHRAQDMANKLEVSIRTIYRDMDTLAASGVPVEGERGVGYMITAAITLPPLNLTLTELEALHLGMAIVGEAADEELQSAAKSLSAKIDAVLPEDRSAPPTGWGFAIYPFADAAKGFQHMPIIRAAIRSRQKLAITYRALDEEVSHRVIRPLQLEYWGRVWTCTVWCEMRSDFRVFRVDRIEESKILPELFVEEPGKTLADYMAKITPKEV
ncbi:helix-turn-helix transcriptional regulator [Pseudohalocynthiibacter aestuariivivens]|uniref:Helix-turn-helix transcriptional regulator n=1 Tax=Pseudohalocynthiibacter aestuariivivens TaxID=1591409 RepID=A0ABV5JJ12_9RHOB|nr:YafY family protein [Pseudohalocynthiibacter aestuariivivens]MBS9716680.1 YafY family transcriptional regulator [Pseudohalocynthiibacter aestuariivivens]